MRIYPDTVYYPISEAYAALNAGVSIETVREARVAAFLMERAALTLTCAVNEDENASASARTVPVPSSPALMTERSAA
jgi:hypothetical protein